MICPHCHKIISWEMPPEAITRAKQLRKEGYSFRDIEFKLRAEGFHCSFSNISRYFRKKTKGKGNEP